MSRADRRREKRELEKKKRTFVFTQEDLDRFRKEQFELAERAIKFQKQDEQQRTIQAFVNFLLVTLEYLETNFHCKNKGMIKFLIFAAEKIKWVDSENQNYFIEMEEQFKEKFGVNVLETVGLERINE